MTAAGERGLRGLRRGGYDERGGSGYAAGRGFGNGCGRDRGVILPAIQQVDKHMHAARTEAGNRRLQRL